MFLKMYLNFPGVKYVLQTQIHGYFNCYTDVHIRIPGCCPQLSCSLYLRQHSVGFYCG